MNKFSLKLKRELQIYSLAIKYKKKILYEFKIPEIRVRKIKSERQVSNSLDTDLQALNCVWYKLTL